MTRRQRHVLRAVSGDSGGRDSPYVTIGRAGRIPGRIYRPLTPQASDSFVKKPLVALFLSAAAIAALAVPADAAVPSKRADRTIDCNDGTGRVARVWTTKNFAADNPCADYLVIRWMDKESASKDEALNVAPGAHFNAGGAAKHTPAGIFSVTVGAPRWCTNWGTYLVTKGSHGKIVAADDNC